MAGVQYRVIKESTGRTVGQGLLDAAGLRAGIERKFSQQGRGKYRVEVRPADGGWQEYNSFEVR